MCVCVYVCVWERVGNRGGSEKAHGVPLQALYARIAPVRFEQGIPPPPLPPSIASVSNASHHASPDGECGEILVTLFADALAPYLDMCEAWCTQGTLWDPHREFFAEKYVRAGCCYHYPRTTASSGYHAHGSSVRSGLSCVSAIAQEGSVRSNPTVGPLLC